MLPFCSDPFADTADSDGTGTGLQEGLIHIRIQQRNGRKTLTTVQGIHPKFDLKKLVKVCKKVSFFVVKSTIYLLFGFWSGTPLSSISNVDFLIFGFFLSR